MTDKATLLALADRVEQSDIADRYDPRALDLNRAIHDLCADYDCGDDEVPEYATSLDAAMTLVPEGWWLAGMHFCPVDFRSELDREYHAEVAGPITWGVIEHGWPEEPQYECEGGNAATPALALTAACLRALANGDDRE